MREVTYTFDFSDGDGCYNRGGILESLPSNPMGDWSAVIDAVAREVAQIVSWDRGAGEYGGWLNATWSATYAPSAGTFRAFRAHGSRDTLVLFYMVATDGSALPATNVPTASRIVRNDGGFHGII